MADIKVGIGGWLFPPWRGVFYPPDLPRKDELAYASRHVTSIEINATFYGPQKPATFRRWYGETPAGFVFSLKGPRIATFRRVLAEVGPAVERFVGSGILELKEKLGPILWQFAGTKRLDEADFAAFLSLLPHERDGVSLRHVVEVRHETFATPRFVEMLRKAKVALAFVDDEDYPANYDLTGDFVYARLERSAAGEPSGYPRQAISTWVERFGTWSAGVAPKDAKHIHPDVLERKGGRDCFVYFISGAKERNPAAAQALLKRLAEAK
ncbi:MAG TPA: DUF72 domain-containing protein [Alphaproteobacteria bacterium]